MPLAKKTNELAALAAIAHLIYFKKFVRVGLVPRTLAYGIKIAYEKQMKRESCRLPLNWKRQNKLARIELTAQL